MNDEWIFFSRNDTSFHMNVCHRVQFQKKNTINWYTKKLGSVDFRAQNDLFTLLWVHN